MEKELTLEARIDNIPQVLDFVNKSIGAAECPEETLLTIDMAVEELFTNISSYAYAPDTGTATVKVEVAGSPPSAVITFIDKGVPYDPLAKKDPDMNEYESILDRKFADDMNEYAEEMPIGGLGIFMVKNSMDSMEYKYENGQNILTIKKNI